MQTYSSVSSETEVNSLDNKKPPPPSSLRPHFGTASKFRGYFTIVACFLCAVLGAAMNHVVFSLVNGKTTGEHISQFWMTILRNAFPAGVVLVLAVALKCYFKFRHCRLVGTLVLSEARVACLAREQCCESANSPNDSIMPSGTLEDYPGEC